MNISKILVLGLILLLVGVFSVYYSWNYYVKGPYVDYERKKKFGMKIAASILLTVGIVLTVWGSIRQISK